MLTGYGDEAREHGTRAMTRERHEQGPTQEYRVYPLTRAAAGQLASERLGAEWPGGMRPHDAAQPNAA
jgi:hypothetical protein